MGPKILFIGTTCPFGDVSGAGVRTLNLLRLLERIGPVTAVFATGREWSAGQLEQTQGAFDVALVSKYLETPIRTVGDRYRKIFDPEFLNTNGVIVPPADRKRVEELVGKHDVVWIHTLKLANAFRRSHWPHTIIDVDDFPSRFHRSAAGLAPSLKMKLMRHQKAFSWRRHEKNCLQRFDLLAVCKEADRGSFGDPSRVHVVPNGFTVPETTAAVVARRNDRLGMIGDFNYLPNHDGLRWFMRDAWSQIREQVPGAELRLIGKGSDAIAKTFPGAGVSGLGYVPDVAEETGSWSCMIVPTRLGGGTHLKVAEGLARKVPIVTTSHGSRGYRLVSGEQAFISDDPREFAKACVTLLRDPDARDRMSGAGWDLFNAHYSWDSIQPAVERAVSDCLSRSARSKS
jgi:glycosyltransferase involved in cell wall biosynthesis